MATVSKKICLLGDFGVGKTSLIRRFVDRQFSDQYLSTVGVKISRKLVESTSIATQQPFSLQLLIWDIEGSTKFKAIASSYLQGAKGAIVVGDMTRQETLTHLTDHLQHFCAINPTGKVVIVLNKLDLIELEKLEKLLPQFQFSEYENVLATYSSSAKTGENVDTIFQLLVQHLTHV
jgi:small GTP-binding protein